ncbi:cyclic nucleotide-binding domain-containing protein [Bdellovibrio bacteriovorus]|uniref:Transcriptional regulator n=1 Tax=Bdellovibrio bacteriovorus TaxID=959 RepID=A0A1Z3N4Q6_BDEBC|nr:cyclic nucleotide-binding domain-containing protein [Bdellovibrio bacteriovorus]ASD62452.1 transcriptional regulator [Bdellovibrio bacteriovorus]
MGRNDQKKNTFLIISGDKTRIHKCTEALNRNFENCSVFHGSEWFEAKYKLDNVHPKAVLVDEYLPKGSGFDIVAKILKEKNNDDIAIIIMSYVADHDIFKHEVASGRIQFLTEPDREKALVDCVSKIISPKVDNNQAQYELKQLQPGDVLFKEGDMTEVAYIVKKGSLRAYSEGPDGDKIMFGEILPGEFVGEMGHFNHEPRSATVEAITEVELIAIPNGSLDNVIFARPSWAKALVKTLSQRLKKANKALTG